MRSKLFIVLFVTTLSLSWMLLAVWAVNRMTEYRVEYISEDNPAWNCSTMGNRVCGCDGLCVGLVK